MHHRDLIENADKIVSIARNSETVLANIKSIQVRRMRVYMRDLQDWRPWAHGIRHALLSALQDAFSSMAHSFATADALLNEKRDSLTKHEELYGELCCCCAPSTHARAGMRAHGAVPGVTRCTHAGTRA